jgi:hypothetical protein
MSQDKQYRHGIPFAWHVPSQRMVTAVEVDKGLTCNCICVACKAPLIARQGAVRIWHFAHHRESDCPHAAEAAIHWMAKQLISDRKGIFVPHRALSKTVEGKRRVWFETLAVVVQEAGFQQITDCRIEESVAGPATESGYRRPDLIAHLNGLPLAIEIHNTNAVDLKKTKWLEQQGFSVLEIDVGDLAALPTDAYKEALEQRLFATAQFSRWLTHVGNREAQNHLNKLEQALRLAKKAEEEALLARLDAVEADRKRKEEFLRRIRDVEQFKICFGRCTVRIGRNNERATLKMYGSAPDDLFSKMVELARQYGGKFNPRGRCWEFYKYSETKAFFDLLCSKAKEIREPGLSEIVQPNARLWPRFSL